MNNSKRVMLYKKWQKLETMLTQQHSYGKKNWKES